MQNFRRKYSKLLLSFIATISLTTLIFTFGINVNAAQKSITQNCILPLSLTNWTKICSITKFDSSLGLLKNVKITVNGEVNSQVQIENKDAQPETITSNISAKISIKKPDSTVILDSIPSKSVSDLFGANDGVMDFGGTSGKTYPSLVSTTSSTSTLSSDSDLSQYIGLGAADMEVTASGLSSFSGSANYVSSVDTSAQASIEVVYFYTDSDLSVNKTHVGNFVEGQDALYTLTVNNKTANPTTDPITLIDTLPNGMSYKSVSDQDWSCTPVGQIVTCVTNKVIPANDSISFDMVVSVDSATNTNTVNRADVSTNMDDMTPLDNSVSNSAIVNHLPSANDSSVNNIVNGLAFVRLPNNTLSGNSNDLGDSISSYTITSLPNPASGLLYLGNPSNGGVLVALNQVLNPSDISDLYFAPVFGFIGNSNFTYKTTDQYGGISNDPGTISLGLISQPGAAVNISSTIATQSSATIQPTTTTSSNSTIIPVSSNSNTTQSSSISLNTAQTSNSSTGSNATTSAAGEVLGVNESVELIRTGGNINRIDQFITVFLYVALIGSLYFFVKNWVELF